MTVPYETLRLQFMYDAQKIHTGAGVCSTCWKWCQYIENCNTLIRTRDMLFEEKKKKFKNALCTDNLYCTVLTIVLYY